MKAIPIFEQCWKDRADTIIQRILQDVPHAGEKTHLRRNGEGEFTVFEPGEDGSQRPEFVPDIVDVQVVFVPKRIIVADAVYHDDKKIARRRTLF